MSVEKLGANLLGLTERQLTNREIATALCNTIRDQVCAAVLKMPEDWDGHEIRQLLSDLFAIETSTLMRTHRSRRKEYERVARDNLYWRFPK